MPYEKIKMSSDAEQRAMLEELLQFVAPTNTRMDIKVPALEHIRFAYTQV